MPTHHQENISAQSTVLLEKAGGLAVLTLNRPEKLNALSDRKSTRLNSSH